jgi:hypothetical protein
MNPPVPLFGSNLHNHFSDGRKGTRLYGVVADLASFSQSARFTDTGLLFGSIWVALCCGADIVAFIRRALSFDDFSSQPVAAPNERLTASVESLCWLSAIVKVRRFSSDARPLHIMKQIIPLFLLLVCGCTSTLTKAELDAKATERAGSVSPDQTYYVGSDVHYDYFVIRGGIGHATRLYRVPESDGAVTNRFAVTKDETYWRGYDLTGIVVTNGAVAIPK